jgi:hypothetical protein
MGWAWFLPALTQISLFLPLILFVYKKAMPNRTLVRIIFSSIITLGTALCFYLTYAANEGALPYGIQSIEGVNQLNTVSFNYLNDVYMKPYFWINTYVFGIVLCLVYNRYSIELREDDNSDSVVEISRSSRLMVAFKSNNVLRYAGYLLGMVMIACAMCWLYPFYSNAQN